MSLALYPAPVMASMTSSACESLATTRTVLVSSAAVTASTPGTAATADSTAATHLPHDISTMNWSAVGGMSSGFTFLAPGASARGSSTASRAANSPRVEERVEKRRSG